MIDKKHKKIYDIFIQEYKKLYGIVPEINYGGCGKLVNEKLKKQSEKAIILIIKIYFEKEYSQVYHLPMILSSYSFNKYLPLIKLNSSFENAEEYNKENY